tara:strand:+ start:1041 stop:1370 length:330 start_codon:yes stop_codon:yes gene_type:complete
MYNQKDLIRINQEIGESGELNQNSSLSFALSLIKQKKSWIFELSYLVRSLVIDHSFVDGNKRTAYLICTLYFEHNNRDYDDEKIVETIYKLAKNNITDINKIGRELLKC